MTCIEGEQILIFDSPTQFKNKSVKANVFYHGTSFLFLESIVKHGLGGINPNIKFKNLELLQYLSTQAEKYLKENQHYQKYRESVLAMANQTDLEMPSKNNENIFLNYRHDCIYVSYSIERAAIYACTNRYGSEILEYCIKLYKLLKERFIDFQLRDDLNLFGIEKYLDYKHRPILIEISGVKDHELETEKGYEAGEVLSNLRQLIPTLSKKEKFEKLQFVNFRLLRTVPINRLKVYEIDFESHPRYKDFEWTMTKISL